MKIIEGPFSGTLQGLAFEFYCLYFEVQQKISELHSLDPLSPWLRFTRRPNDPEFLTTFDKTNLVDAGHITHADMMLVFGNYLEALKHECQRLRAAGASP